MHKNRLDAHRKAKTKSQTCSVNPQNGKVICLCLFGHKEPIGRFLHISDKSEQIQSSISYDIFAEAVGVHSLRWGNGGKVTKR
jgi:hypothetical protein